ncbi:MAG: cobalamin-binding protein [Magnetovibrio sp.]|nr:cobalamin-binding protein [Magnetovibrio sp.]
MVDSYVDDAGQVHGRVKSLPRILSLVPSLTELLFALGLGKQVVGRTHYCVHPVPAITKIPCVGGTKKINFRKAADLNPTHALVNIDETPKSLADNLSNMGIEIIVTHPLIIKDNLKLFKLLGGIFRSTDKAEELTIAFDQALRELLNRSNKWLPKKTLYLIWEKPWMTISPDTYIADVLKQANWITNTYSSVDRYPKINLNDHILRAVDLVFFSSEPYPFNEKHLRKFQQNFPEHAEKAKLIDAEMGSWYGSRSIIGLHYLADFADL